MSRVRLINLKSWISHVVKCPHMCCSIKTTMRCSNSTNQLPRYVTSRDCPGYLGFSYLDETWSKRAFGVEKEHALHYWEGLCQNGLRPVIKLYIPSLCFIFKRFLWYLRVLECEICLVSLGCILLEATRIPGCYHFPRVGTLCPLTPFGACHTLMFFSSCPMSLGQTFCELWR